MKTSFVLSVKVIPNSKENEIVGWEEECLKVRIHAPPDKGKANRELIRFLLQVLSISTSEIDFISGHTSRKKLLRIHLSKEELQRRLSLFK